MYLFQQSIWLSGEQHLLQGQPAVIASAPHGPAGDTTAQELRGTQQMGLKENAQVRT